MRQVKKLWPLLTATHRYDKSISTHGRGKGQLIEAPILAYLIETANGRILYDVGCDYTKISHPVRNTQYYNPDSFHFGAPVMSEQQRIPSYLQRLGISPADIDLIFISHLHFDHAGGLNELRGCGCCAEVHVQADELAAASSRTDPACFDDEIADAGMFCTMQGEYTLSTGIHAVSTPGHTAGHMSLMVELPKGPPVLLAGDAADLQENIDDEVAPGACWQDQYETAINSIRKLKHLARNEHAQIWPNHDMAFFRSLRPFPTWHE